MMGLNPLEGCILLRHDLLRKHFSAHYDQLMFYQINDLCFYSSSKSAGYLCCAITLALLLQGVMKALNVNKLTRCGVIFKFWCELIKALASNQFPFRHAPVEELYPGAVVHRQCKDVFLKRTG